MLFVVTGPESTGKTTLTAALAEHLQAPYVAEAARAYLQDKYRYEPSDVLAIAHRQQQLERGVLARDPQVAIADTDLQVVYIWWQERIGPAPEILRNAYAQQSPRYYLLCRPDLPWEADPLRENPDDRDRLWQVYLADLSARQLPFSVVEGKGRQRFDCAVRVINRVLSGGS
ncbi:MAG: AAA family ATPase [bacterium]